MPLDMPGFVTRLRAAVPEAELTLREHLADNDDEVLLHLLTADLRRLAVSTYRAVLGKSLQNPPMTHTDHSHQPVITSTVGLLI